MDFEQEVPDQVNPSETAPIWGSMPEEPYRTRGGGQEPGVFPQICTKSWLKSRQCGFGCIHDRASCWEAARGHGGVDMTGLADGPELRLDDEHTDACEHSRACMQQHVA